MKAWVRSEASVCALRVTAAIMVLALQCHSFSGLLLCCLCSFILILFKR